MFEIVKKLKYVHSFTSFKHIHPCVALHYAANHEEIFNSTSIYVNVVIYILSTF